ISKAGAGSVEWRWLLTPKKPGTHIVRLEFDKPVITEKSIKLAKELGRVPPELELKQNGLEAKVQVLTALGLTAAQDSLAKAGGSVAGFCGPLLAYPFIKRLFERPPPAPSPPSAPPPPVGSRKRRKSR